MECTYKVTKNKKLRRCGKTCYYKYCSTHWGAVAKKNYKGLLFLLAFFSGVFTWLANFQTVKGWFKTKHESFIEEKYIPGFLFYPQSNNNEITISSGNSGSYSQRITDESLYFGNAIFAGCFGSNTQGKEVLDEGHSFSVKVRNNVLLVSFIVRDLKTEEIICEVVDNKWKIKKDIKDFYSDSKSLEIIDKYGFPAFSIWIDDNSVVQYRGYFIGQLCATFTNGEVFKFVQKNDPQYAQKCYEYALELKPQFAKAFTAL